MGATQSIARTEGPTAGAATNAAGQEASASEPYAPAPMPRLKKAETFEEKLYRKVRMWMVAVFFFLLGSRAVPSLPPLSITRALFQTSPTNAIICPSMQPTYVVLGGAARTDRMLGHRILPRRGNSIVLPS